MKSKKGKKGSFLLGLLLICFLFPSFLWAAEITDVASSFDKDSNKKIDFRLRMTYDFFQESGVIAREKGVFPSAGQQYFSYSPELEASHSKHQLILNPVIGLYRGLEFGLRLPLILSESIETKKSSDPNSGTTLTNQGILSSADQSSFLGGIPYLIGDISLYLQWAPFNDRKYADRHWATWVLGFEYTGPIGGVWTDALWDPRKANKDNSIGPSQGAHLFTFHTTLSKRVHKNIEPYARIWYRVGVATRGVNELYINEDWKKFHQSFQSANSDPVVAKKENDFHKNLVERAINDALKPSHAAGFMLGSEFLLWQNLSKNMILTMDLRFFTEAYFEGRYYTLTSNALAGYNPTTSFTNAAGAIQQQPLRASPITDYEQHYKMGGFWAIQFKFHRLAYVRLSGNVTVTPDFFVTGAKRGVDMPDANGVQDGFVKLGTDEEYPFYVQELDAIGKRLRQMNTLSFSFQLAAGLTF